MPTLELAQAMDPLLLAIAREVDAVARAMGLPYFIVGATARDILLTGVFRIPAGRATRDIDFAIAVADWPQFETLKHTLAAGGRFVACRREPQRLTHCQSGCPLDIIPFRGTQQHKRTLAWPPDMKVIMNLTGYEEALAHALHVSLDTGLVVPVASLPGLAVLKIFAWADRGSGGGKDAMDLVTLLSCHADAGNLDRLYGGAASLLEAVDYELARASPRLLGADVRVMVTAETRDQLLALLGNGRHWTRLCMDMARALRSTDQPLTRAEQLLEQFYLGLQG